MSLKNLSRKSFLKIAGASTAAAALAGCGVNSIPPEPEPELNLGPDPRPNDVALYLGSGDTGLFNFIYSVEQLEAAFFTQVMENPYPGMNGEEARILGDIQQHETAHRDFYKAFLGENGIHQLSFEFFSTNFSSRQSVLADARFFEDVTVSMYNNIAELFTNPDYINTIIKIASVEARHAAALANLIQPDSTSFISDDLITPRGLDVINTPRGTLKLLLPFIYERLDILGLPT